jgi:hypothetical protein
MKENEYDGTNGNGYQPKRDANAVDGWNAAPPDLENCPDPSPAPPKLAELKIDRDNFLALASFLHRNMEGLIEYHRVVARLQRERYVSLLAVGFSEAQALEMLKTPLIG